MLDPSGEPAMSTSMTKEAWSTDPLMGRGGGLQSAAPPRGLQGLLLESFQVLCARALHF